MAIAASIPTDVVVAEVEEFEAGKDVNGSPRYWAAMDGRLVVADSDAHLAAEKALKAMLIRVGVEVPRIQDLVGCIARSRRRPRNRFTHATSRC